jgi:cysteine desulfurase/selenocysteine lyase
VTGMEKTITNCYFDNAATSWPKPEEVYTAAEKFMRHGGANPGRSGHTRALRADRLVYETRERAASFLGAKRPEEIIFTLNATDSLNMAIKGVLEPGDHVIYTSMEHNSILRPLGALRQAKVITTTMISCDSAGQLDPADIEKAVLPETKLIISTNASNVTGGILPVKEVGQIAREKGILFLVDAAQTAGALPLDIGEIGADLAAFTGHKSLLGPPGVGLLYLRSGVKIKPWREGGTGSRSDEELQPEIMPDYLEAGTMNTAGIAGLNEGLKYLQKVGIRAVRQHEIKINRHFIGGLRELSGIRVYGSGDPEQSVAVTSFTMEGIDSGELGYILEEAYGILSRTGLHCAPGAHRSIGTFPQGTVRFSFGCFTREEEIDYALNALKKIISRFLPIR